MDNVFHGIRRGHCEAIARSLYGQRTFDWLDETLGIADRPLFGLRAETGERG